ncbi:hypothetical protein ES703_77296 [subsurface metagenome]
MIEGRDSRGRFMRKQVVRKMINEGVVKLEPVQVICPACGEQVEVVARDGHVKGYCAVARRYVDFLIETQLERKNYRQGPEYQAKQSIAHMGKHHTAETKAKLSAVHMGKHRQHAAETRVKISSALMGKPLTAETKAKISAAKKGKPLTAEHRAKISAALKRQLILKGGHKDAR